MISFDIHYFMKVKDCNDILKRKNSLLFGFVRRMQVSFSDISI